MEEEVIRKNISFRNSTQQPQKHIIQGFCSCFERTKSNKEQQDLEHQSKALTLNLMKQHGGFDNWSKEKIDQFFQQIHFLARDSDEEVDFLKLQNKTLYMKQLMNLKIRGRYIDETQYFLEDVKQLPSVESQKAVVSLQTCLSDPIEAATLRNERVPAERGDNED